MLYYDKIDLNEGIGPAKSYNCKFLMACDYRFLSMGLIFKILSVMIVMIWQYSVLILAILLLSLLKELIIVVLFMALANVKQFIC